MKVKLIDVANKAGVSKSTASQYLNGRYEYMSEKTRERIRQAVEELDFVPNPIARSLKTQKTNTIGIMVSNIDGPITGKAIRGVDDYCKKHNYNLLIYNTDYDPKIEKASIDTLKSLRADGLIIASSGLINSELNKADTGNLPVVHLHRDFEDLHVNTAFSDFKKGSFDATEYLIRLNHKRIGVISRPYVGTTTREDRIKGYKNALDAHQLPIDETLIKSAETADEIIAAIESLLGIDEPPTAIFTLYTKITEHLLLYCNDNNIDIPKDLSVIAFDDLPLAKLFKSPLTAVAQSGRELGTKACELLLKKIEHPEDTHENVELPCHMVIRESCRKIDG